MKKKKTDIKMIVGMVVLVAVLVLIGGSFWSVVSMQAQKDKEEETRIEAEAVLAIYLETGDFLKEPVYVDLKTHTVFTTDVPEEGIYNKKGTLIRGDVLENGDKVKIYGDNAMTMSIPAQYPGITKMQRIGRASLEETWEYLEIANETMGIGRTDKV